MSNKSFGGGCVYVFTNTIDNGANPKAHQKHAQKMLPMGHLYEEKMPMQEIGDEKGGGHLLEEGVFSGA